MSRWWDLVQAGMSLAGEVVIDAHTHMGPWFNFHIPGDPWAEGMVRTMDAVGVRSCIAAPHVGIGPDMAEANRLSTAAATRFPGRILAYCCISPNASEEAILRELDRLLLPRENPAALGIKIHPSTHAYPANGSRYRPMWEFADAHGVPVLSHTWGGDPHSRPGLFREIAREFPRVPILLGHSGGTWAGADEALAAAAATEMLSCDLASSHLKQGLLERMVREIGSERIVFGSDLPFIDCRAQVGYVASARISDEDKRRIFGLNAARLFGIPV